MVEQRVIGQKIGARPAASPPPPAPEDAPAPDGAAGGTPKRRRRGRLLVVALVVVVLAIGGVAAYLFLLKPGAAEAAEPPPPPEPVPGDVLTVDPVSVNLADGHYLRLGLALQLTADVAEDPDPSRALDLAIAWYSGRPITEVTDPASRTSSRRACSSRSRRPTRAR